MAISPVASQAISAPQSLPLNEKADSKPIRPPGETQANAADSAAVGGKQDVNRPNAKEPAPEDTRKALDDINKFVHQVTSDITFSIDEDTGKSIIKVVDRQTNEVIRQIPAQEVVEIAKALDKLQGLLIKQSA